MTKNFSSPSNSHADRPQTDQSENPTLPRATIASIATIKAANPVIFPSLHPLGGLYRNQGPSRSTTPVRREIEAQNPVKKVKTDPTKREVVVLISNNEVKDKMVVEEDSKLRKGVQMPEKAAFGVPRLPRRLTQEKAQQPEQAEFLERLREFRSVGESVLPAAGMNTYMRSQIPAQTGVKMSQTGGKYPQGQRENALGPLVDPLILYAIYEDLKQEFDNFQMVFNMMNAAGK